MKISTKSGFECVIDERVTKDYRFLRLVRRFYSKDQEVAFSACADLIPYVLGDEQEEKLVAFCTDEDGYSSVEKVFNVFTEIFQQMSNQSDNLKKY